MPTQDPPTITYAGIPLLYPDPDHRLIQWIARWLPSFAFESRWPSVSHTDQRSESVSARVPGRPQSLAGLPTPNWPAPPKPRLNTLYWPTGASRWATAYFVVEQERYAAIMEAVDKEDPKQPQPLVCTVTDSRRNSVTLETDLYLLPQIPVTAPFLGTPLHLLRLTDARYYFQYLDWGDPTLDDSTTWANLISALQTALDTDIEYGDSVDAGYLQPDWQEFYRPYENAALILDALCESIGRRFVAKLNGEFHLETAATSLSARYSTFSTSVSVTHLAGGVSALAPTNLSFGPVEDLKPIIQYQSELPPTIRLVYPKYDGNVSVGDADVYYVDQEVSSLTLETGSFGFSTPSDTSLLATGRKVIFSTLSADFHGVSGGTPNNDSDLQAHAERVATDWVNWRMLQYAATYNALHPLDSSGHDDYILWHLGSQFPLQSLETGQRTLRHEESQSSLAPAPIDPGYTFYTELVSLPCNFGSCEQLSQSFADPVCTDACIPGTVRIATADGDITQDDYGTVTLLDQDLVSTGESVEALAALGDVTSGDRLAIACVLGCWVIIAEEC